METLGNQRRTLQLYITVRIVFSSSSISLLVNIVVIKLVAILVVSFRVVANDRSLVACVFNFLAFVSHTIFSSHS